MEFLGASEMISLDLDDLDVYYSPEYGRSAELIDGGTWECAISRRGLIFPYIRREIEAGGGYDIISPYGYGGVQATSPEELSGFRAEFLEESRDRGLVAEFLRAHPLDMDETMVRAWSVDSFRCHKTVGVSVGDNPETYFSEAAGRHRTAVRKAEKSGVHVREVDPASIISDSAPFRRLYDATMERVGASERLLLNDDYFVRLNELGADKLLVLEAYTEEVGVVAAAMFMRNGSRVHYHLSGSGAWGQKYGATNMLIDYAIRQLVPANGWLHLGGGLSEDDGLFRFKRSIGNRTYSTAMCRTVVNHARYAELVGASGVGTTDYFPAYRAVS